MPATDEIKAAAGAASQKTRDNTAADLPHLTPQRLPRTPRKTGISGAPAR